MKIKKFTGRSFQEAFDRVKEELGAEAIILNSRKVKEGGVLDFMNSKEVYEITAAADHNKSGIRTAQTLQHAHRAYKKQNTANPSIEKSNKGNGAPGVVVHPEVNDQISEQTYEIKALQQEVKDIKKVLKQVSDFLKYSRMPAMPEHFKTILKKLTDHDVHEDLAKAMIQTVYAKMNPADYKNRQAIEKNLMAMLTRMIRIAKPLEKISRTPHVVALVGPTGVGKTTTVAKIAANLKLYHKKKIALISADTYRIAAVEQLQTFANIANIPMDVIYSPEEMRQAIYKFRERDIVLIDTVGRSQKNEQHLKDLYRFVEMANPNEVHLVLSLTTSLKNLLDITRRFAVMRPNRTIFTKIDEATNAGNILNVLYKHHIPVSYITNGQVVPNDITTADQTTLSNIIYKGVFN